MSAILDRACPLSIVESTKTDRGGFSKLSSALSQAATSVADQKLIQLACELEAAAQPFLAYDRDATVTSADPDFEEALETGRRLYGAVKAVADRIFTHQPESLAGLLVQAHAASLVAEHSWDDTSEQVGQDGTLLRQLANGLFRLAGVDWRGRPLEGVPAIQADIAPAAVADDAAFLALAPTILPMLDLFDDLFEKSKAKHAVAEAEAEALDLDLGTSATADLPSWMAYMEVRDPVNALDEAIAAIVTPHMERPVSSLDALLLKQRIGRSLRQYESDTSDDLDALVSARLASGQPLVGGSRSHAAAASAASPDAALIPLAEAAIAEERAASALLEASGYDSRPGVYDRSLHLLELVTATEARTPAGLAAKARLLLTHRPEVCPYSVSEDCEALALSLARDAARLGAAG